jgi:uncharacterized protein
MKKIFVILLGILVGWIGFMDPIFSLDVPPLQGRVMDSQGYTSESFRQNLETLLLNHEVKTSNQIAVLIIPSLQGEVLEEYSLKVAETWKLGQKKKDNGVLLLIAIEDRKMRIEVGYGLEGDLPDVICRRILDFKMKPKFKNEDYEGGIQDGVSSIFEAINKSYTNDDSNFYDANAEEPDAIDKNRYSYLGPLSFVGDFPENSEVPLVIAIPFFLFFLGVIGVFTYLAAFFAYVGWFIACFLIIFWLVFPSALLGTKIGVPIFLTYFVSMFSWKIIALVTPWGRKIMKKRGIKASGGGKGSSSRGGSSWSSSGSSSSSSGGGGSFGGGGSSSSW